MTPHDLPADGVGDESADRVDRNPPLVPGRRDYTPDESRTRWRHYLLACLIGAGFYTTLWLLYQSVGDTMSDEHPLGADSDTHPCRMREQYPYDFAWCETHDETFAIGSVCRYYTPVSSPHRGDRAADSPGTGGAPTS